jgi:hypothetical protein
MCVVKCLSVVDSYQGVGRSKRCCGDNNQGTGSQNLVHLYVSNSRQRKVRLKCLGGSKNETESV